MAKRQKVKTFSFQQANMSHVATTEKFANLVDTLYQQATNDIVSACAKIKPGDDVFKFGDFPSVQKEVDNIIQTLTGQITAVISKGSRQQWLYACKKNNEFLRTILNTSKLKQAELKKMQARNLDALKTFQGRKVNGMDLSKRVWNYTSQHKGQIEVALDAGLGEGKSAQQLARDVKQYLKYPDKLFRRVRDKHGQLQLSKAAKAFHPGQGVYRSSVRNAQRLARTEINMAYRESDWLRWQQLDYVIGIEVHRSNHEPLCKCKMCQKLVGRYPKTMKFTGWHPQCMCYVTPILADQQDFDDDQKNRLKAALNGESYNKSSAKQITEMPEGFKEWVAENVDKQSSWASTPYFIRDNFNNGRLSDGLKIKFPSVSASGKVVYNKPFDQLSEKEKADWVSFISSEYPLDYEFTSACRLYGIDISSLDNNLRSAHDGNEYWREQELRTEISRTENQLKDAIAKTKAQAEQILKDFAAVVKEADGWIDEQQTVYDYALNMFKQEQAEQYPNYVAIVNSATNGSSLNIAIIRKKIAQAKTDYAQAIADAKSCISKYSGKVDVTKLQSLVNEQRTTTRNSLRITNDIKKEITEVERKWNESQNGALTSISDRCENNGIEHRNVRMHTKQPTADEIIERISGGDTTGGSCSSMAFTFAANMGGMDVLDYRGGMSRRFFSSSGNILDIAKSVGGFVNKNFNDYKNAAEMLATTTQGKYYYFTCGAHAAIVRKTSSGYEYLELQSPVKERNGWHALNDERLKNRFGAKRSHSFYGSKYETKECIIDIELLNTDAGFRKMMGYINTASDKQNKGVNGHEY